MYICVRKVFIYNEINGNKRNFPSISSLFTSTMRRYQTKLFRHWLISDDEIVLFVSSNRKSTHCIRRFRSIDWYLSVVDIVYFISAVFFFLSMPAEGNKINFYWHIFKCHWLSPLRHSFVEHLVRSVSYIYRLLFKFIIIALCITFLPWHFLSHKPILIDPLQLNLSRHSNRRFCYRFLHSSFSSSRKSFLRSFGRNERKRAKKLLNLKTTVVWNQTSE